jgi:hypothetical protein
VTDDSPAAMGEAEITARIPLGEPERLAGGLALEHHADLFAAVAEGPRATLEHRAHPPRGLAQHGISRRVPVRVVDLLEVIEIEQHQRHRSPARQRPARRVVEQREPHPPAVEARELVGARLAGHVGEALSSVQRASGVIGDHREHEARDPIGHETRVPIVGDEHAAQPLPAPHRRGERGLRIEEAKEVVLALREHRALGGEHQRRAGVCGRLDLDGPHRGIERALVTTLAQARLIERLEVRRVPLDRAPHPIGLLARRGPDRRASDEPPRRVALEDHRAVQPEPDAGGDAREDRIRARLRLLGRADQIRHLREEPERSPQRAVLGPARARARPSGSEVRRATRRHPTNERPPSGI